MAIDESGPQVPAEQEAGPSAVLPLASATVGLFVVTILLLYRVPRLASYAGIGGTWYSVPFGHALRVAGTIVLAACFISTVRVRRHARLGDVRRVRRWLAGTLALALLALALGIYECGVYVMAGVTPNRYETVLYDYTDLHYLHAVRRQLKQFAARADSAPAAAAAGDAAGGDLSLSDRLQRDMVTWTEQQVALWESDINQRWADLMLFDYQIRPRPDGRGPAEAKYRAEVDAIKQEQELLPVLRDYCRARLVKMGKLPPGAADSGPALDDLERRLQHLSETATVQQGRMIDWAMSPDAEPRWITSQMNLAQKRLRQIDGRLEFAAEYLDPLFIQSQPRGVAARHPELRLPIQLPDIRGMARALMLVRWTLVLWMFVGFVTLVPAAWRQGRAAVRPGTVATVIFWQILAGVGVLAFLLLG